jgi:superfamily II DNA or RNA helicase/HKD family nuclease
MPHLPKGVYDRLITSALLQALEGLPNTLQWTTEDLAPEDAVEYLARELADRARVLLRSALGPEASKEEVLILANRLLSVAGPEDPAHAKLLTAITARPAMAQKPPIVPLSQSALVTNDQGLNYHSILRSELLSADRVDLVCPFIGNQGLNLILDLLQDLGTNLRVITTTYLGGTHLQALERLARTGAQIKIVYEKPSQKTALHAKAWIFHRESGYSTATIGSSNLSPRALVDGLEWNVRIGGGDAPQVLRELILTFDRLWSEPIYESFDPERDAERVRRELAAQRSDGDDAVQFFADLTPLPHQKEALEALAYERLDGRHRNLIVAATGTGKTLLAGFDYERLARQWGGRPSLLFVAHREDILKQSVGAFRAVMRDSDFGELNVGGHRAEAWKHVFASVQSLASKDLNLFEPRRFDMIVVDEFHHAEAPTYTRLLEYFQPRELLGLTATPERHDGKRGILESLWPPTFELRLWHALERNLLCPFHYFGIDDGTDLSELKWTNGRYEDAELERAFIERGEERARLIIRELREKVVEPEMRVVAFCASIRHSDFMAEQFRKAGFQAQALHSGLHDEERRAMVRRFRTGELPIVCTVDLFNEGVDIPEINTVLFLRPTESATVFVQQLGRGLRNHRDKGALTVLDFVGRQNQKFRMDLRFRAMTGLSRLQLKDAVEEGFPMLPPGCDIRLDRVTMSRVLDNLRQAIPSNLPQLIAEVRRLTLDGSTPGVSTFLKEAGLEPEDLYRSNRSYLQVLKAANLYAGDLPTGHHRIRALIHPNDRRRLKEYRNVVCERPADRTYGRMLAFPLTIGIDPAQVHPLVREELDGLFEYLEERAMPLPLVAPDLPFSLHALYSRDEIVAPFRDDPRAMVAGTFHVPESDLDIHLITLRKTERHFSPTTRYQDYFEAQDLLHWETPARTSLTSAPGQRYTQGIGRHLFFVREHKEVDGRPEPFVCIGFGRPISHESEKPIQIRFRLEHEVPDHLYVHFR